MSGLPIAKRLILLAAKLYPASWRARYGEEFEALLEDSGASGRIALDVLGGALLMQIRRWRKAAAAAFVAGLALVAATWRAGQRPFITPGTHQIFRMDTSLGALFEFMVIVVLGIVALMIVARVPRAGRISAGIVACYLAGVLLVSLLTPRTIISIGDSYCWDLWCLGIQKIDAAPQGQMVLYKADVSLSTDSTNVQTLRSAAGAENFLYVTDEQGRRFPVQSQSVTAADITVQPGESVKSSLTFLAPANARSLYLAGDVVAPPWVALYFGSDLNPFHRRTLLRVV